MSFTDDITVFITPSEIPFLRVNLKFNVHYVDKYEKQPFVTPIKIAFSCDKITYGHPIDTQYISETYSVPCVFYAVIQGFEVETMKIDHITICKKYVIKATTHFFNSIIQNEDFYTKRFGFKLHTEKIKSLTNIYERKTLIEKNHKRHKNKKK